MKKTCQYILMILIFCTFLFCYSDFTLAHGTGHRMITDRAAVTVEFFYSDNEPMSYAEVFVFGPHDHEVEYQNGRTDQKGRFSFYPSEPGVWRIEAGDGMGHKEVGTIEVQKEIADEVTSKNIPAMDAGRSAMPSVFIRTITGLSLILNLFLIFYIWKTLRMPMKQKDLTP
jgi:nickel transport protein